MMQEHEEIHQNKSLIQCCMTAIRTRENCLEQLKDLFNHVKPESDEFIQKIMEMTSHLRILTINAIEQI